MDGESKEVEIRVPSVEQEFSGDISATGGVNTAEVLPATITEVAPYQQLSPGPGANGPDARKLYEKMQDFLSAPAVSRWKTLPEIVDELDVPQEKLDPFIRKKLVIYKGGPADGDRQPRETMPADGLICFFQNNNGTPEQAVYKMQLKEIERTEEQRKAGAAIEWEWVAEYQGKRRYIPLGTVNGIRKGS